MRSRARGSPTRLPKPDSRVSPAALEWIARFRQYLCTERRLSPHTDSNYARDLAALVRYCERQGLKDWAALDNQHLRSFAAHSHATGLGPRSIQRRLSAVRAFYGFLMRESRLKPQIGSARHLPVKSPGVRGNPAEGVRAPKAQRRLPETLDA